MSALKNGSATIVLDDDLTTLARPREQLREEDLDEERAVLAARWELIGDGRSLLALEPAIDLPADPTGERLVDLYGTPWGEVLTDADRPFVQSIIDNSPHRTIRQPRIKVTIGG